MGWHKRTLDEAMEYAKERAQRLGSIQRVIPVKDGYRVGGENRMDFFYPDALGFTVYPIY